jgi:hypothetical protein
MVAIQASSTWSVPSAMPSAMTFRQTASYASRRAITSSRDRRSPAAYPTINLPTDRLLAR